jgi:YVTN family beta-propeller protein
VRTGLALVDIRTRQCMQFVPLPRTFNGIAFSHDGKSLYVSGGNSNFLYVFSIGADRQASLIKTINFAPEADPRAPVANFFTGLAVHPLSGRVYVCSEATSEIWIVNPQTGKIEGTMRTGPYPNTCLFGPGANHLFVSNWGDRSVSVIDTRTTKMVGRVGVGIRPNDMALAPDGRIFVACAGDNTVHVFRSQAPKAADQEADETRPPPMDALEIISTSLYAQSPEGSSPCALAVTPDGMVLFVANADNNDVAVVNIADARASNVAGFIPTGWYPTAVATNGRSLFVGNGKGLASRPNVPPISGQMRMVGGILYDHPTGVLAGSVSFIAEPTGAELAAYTEQVRKNSPYTPETLHAVAHPVNSIIPSKVGQDCPIKHVLYIIRENRTYDQVLGDLKDASGKAVGNGDASLTMFGEDITPNAHQLAREYVALDNLYCNGEVSVDGHSWCDGAIATDFKQRSWVIRYSRHGTIPGNDDMHNPATGFLWDLCRRHGVSFRCYGEGARAVPTNNRGTWPGGRDMTKIEGFIEDLKAAEKADSLPQFMIMALGEDHTHGTTPGDFTPGSCVASNDIALGKLMDALTRSKFWPEMAVFVIEDDAQNGPDHVDAHRTVGFVLSPFVKRGFVDSTPYTTTSMVRTMELILGLPPMTQYDAAATPMFNCFGGKGQSVVYNVRSPKVDVAAKNTAASPGARASAAMDFSEVDEAPEDELNRILWAAMKGPDVAYRAPVHRAVFTD